MIHVSAGVVMGPEGTILVCRRGEGRHHAHLWEFPGGKQEAGETAAECLARELREELSLPVAEIVPLCEREEEGIHFTFLRCRALGTPVAAEHEAICFVQPRQMLLLAFCPADTAVAQALALNAPPLRHFFWDLDGTLMDTYPAMVATLLRACLRFGVREDAARVLDLMKENLRYAIERLAERHGIGTDALAQAYQQENMLLEPASIRPIPGIPEALRALAALGGRHYLVTHRDRSALEMLRHAGLLDCFTGVVTSEDGFPRKPQPDSCLHLLQRYAIPPEQAVMIGDRPLDTAAGRAAGMLSCLLDLEGRFPDDPCELRTDSALLLPQLLCPQALGQQADDASVKGNCL